MAKRAITATFKVEQGKSEVDFSSVFNLDEQSVKVGVLSQSGQDLVTSASANEFGTDIAGKNHNVIIPERSFIRSTLDDEADELTKLAGKIVNLIVSGQITRTRGLQMLGQHLQARIRKKIVDLREPPNAPSTIAAKHSDNPLVDTGRLLQSITYEVE